MASNTNNLFLLSFFILFLLPVCIAKTTFRPKALILPVTKDAATLKHITFITHKNPLQPIKLVADLGGHTLWVDCQNAYNSSTYKHVKCNSAQCKLAKSQACGDGCNPKELPKCIKDTCYNTPVNPFLPSYYSGGVVSEDVILIQSTNGSKLGQAATLPRFIFTCVPSWFSQRLPNGVIGLAGLGRSRIALPTQFAQTFSFPRKFGICLSSSTKSKGVIIFGDDPYVMLPNIDISKNLVYTPLITNPSGIGSFLALKEPSSEYFIGVKGIKINCKTVKLNTTLLSTFDSDGNGGTKISTTTPYGVLETSIYNAVTKAFIEQLPSNVTRVAPVKPFGVCLSSKSIASTRVGPAVPPIDLVLQNDKVVWRIFAANSMVQVNKDVMCLGFVDEAVNYQGHSERLYPVASIVIGAHQIEDNLLQFDLARSRLGFSSSLLFRQTTCANFDFASHHHA